MDSSSMTAERDSQTGEIVFTRVVKAPKQKVFDVWTKCEHLRKWWGPKGFPVGHCKVDLRPGGMFHYSMVGPQGMVMWGKFVYGEVTPPDKLVFTVSFSDENGGTTRHPMSETWPLEVVNTLTLEDHPSGTLLTLRGGPVNASDLERSTFADGFASMQQGFKGTFEQLDEYLTTT